MKITVLVRLSLSLVISPIPFRNKVNIQFNNHHTSIKVELLELITGYLVLSQEFTKGMYVIRAYTEEQLLGIKRIVHL